MTYFLLYSCTSGHAMRLVPAKQHAKVKKLGFWMLLLRIDSSCCAFRCKHIQTPHPLTLQVSNPSILIRSRFCTSDRVNVACEFSAAANGKDKNLEKKYSKFFYTSQLFLGSSQASAGAFLVSSLLARRSRQ